MSRKLCWVVFPSTWFSYVWGRSVCACVRACLCCLVGRFPWSWVSRWTSVCVCVCTQAGCPLLLSPSWAAAFPRSGLTVLPFNRFSGPAAFSVATEWIHRLTACCRSRLFYSPLFLLAFFWNSLYILKINTFWIIWVADILLFYALLMIFICEQILNFNAVKFINLKIYQFFCCT